MFRIFSLWRQTALHSGLGRVYYEQPYPRNAWPSPASPHQPIAGLWAVYPSAANAQQSLRRRKLSPDVPAITQRTQARPAGVFQPLAFFSSRTPTQGVIYLELSDRREHAWMTGQSSRPASPQGWWLLGRVDICLLTRGCPPPKPRACWTIHNRTSNDHIFGCYSMAMNTKTYGSDSLKYFQQVSLGVKWEFTTSWEPILPHRNMSLFLFCFKSLPAHKFIKEPTLQFTLDKFISCYPIWH